MRRRTLVYILDKVWFLNALVLFLGSRPRLIFVWFIDQSSCEWLACIAMVCRIPIALCVRN
jgi:hypothetical protein